MARVVPSDLDIDAVLPFKDFGEHLGQRDRAVHPPDGHPGGLQVVRGQNLGDGVPDLLGEGDGLVRAGNLHVHVGVLGGENHVEHPQGLNVHLEEQAHDVLPAAPAAALLVLGVGVHPQLGEEHPPVPLQGEDIVVDGHVDALVQKHGGDEVLECLLHLGAALPPEGPGGGGGQLVGKADGPGAVGPAPPAFQ